MLFTKKIVVGFLVLIVALVIAIIMTDKAEAKGLPRRGSIINSGNRLAEVRVNALFCAPDGTATIRLGGTAYNVLAEGWENKHPYLYLGFGYGFGFEPVLGYSVNDKEFFGALCLYPEWENWRGYSNMEYQSKKKSFYYLFQIERKFGALFGLGIETEGWGKDSLMSNGFGFHLGFNLKHRAAEVRVEAAMQLRDDESWTIVRVIVSSKMKSHTPDTRRYR